MTDQGWRSLGEDPIQGGTMSVRQLECSGCQGVLENRVMHRRGDGREWWEIAVPPQARPPSEAACPAGGHTLVASVPRGQPHPSLSEHLAAVHLDYRCSTCGTRMKRQHRRDRAGAVTTWWTILDRVEGTVSTYKACPAPPGDDAP